MLIYIDLSIQTNIFSLKNIQKGCSYFFHFNADRYLLAEEGYLCPWPQNSKKICTQLSNKDNNKTINYHDQTISFEAVKSPLCEKLSTNYIILYQELYRTLLFSYFPLLCFIYLKILKEIPLFSRMFTHKYIL